MDDSTNALLIANAGFYTALSLADFALMQRLWLDTPEAVCVHPGWPALYGWDAIRASWRQIFENQGPLRAWAGEAQVRGTGSMQTRASNVYRRVAGAWKLLEHHALAMPSGAVQPPERFSFN